MPEETREGIRLGRSPVHTLENDRNPREDRRLARARRLQGLGFRVLDAQHTAYAEEAGARWLVTTDDQLIASGQRHHDALGVEIVNPIRLLEPLRGGQE